MIRLICIGSLVLAFSIFTFGQYAPYVEAVKIDEFSKLGHCDLGARIDNLYINIMSARSERAGRDTKGVIVFYRSTKTLPSRIGTYPKAYLAMKDHIRFRSLDPLMVEFIDGGYEAEVRFELYILPTGAQQPTPSKSLPKPTVPSGKTFLWGASRVDYEFGHLEKKQIIIDRYLITEAEDAEYYPESVSEGLHTVITDADVDEKNDWLESSFAERLSKEADETGVVIYYFDDRWFDGEKVRAEVERGIRVMLDEAGLKSNRIQIINGGFGTGVNVKFWIKGRNTNSPVPKPEARPDVEGEYSEPNYGYGEIG